MGKKLLIIFVFLVLGLGLFYIGGGIGNIVRINWIINQMGPCKTYAHGLMIFGNIIYQEPIGVEPCI